MKSTKADPFVPGKLLVHTSAPCRVDLGGTLDLSTFYYPLMHLSPCTFNMAINMRTHVRVFAHPKGRVKISSSGFAPVEVSAQNLPFDHPMGLVFAIAHYFRADGIHIAIDSESPPRSALGGSSVAAVALIGALTQYDGAVPRFPDSKKEIALLARDLEALTVQTPCGIQDHLAAAFGGVNGWYWQPGFTGKEFVRKIVIGKNHRAKLEKCLLLAYCGAPHVSLNANNQWVRQFMAGKNRGKWEEIAMLTRQFITALSKMDIPSACAAMNRETRIRMGLTPDVLDDAGKTLAGAARKHSCGARFAGAGGGGCVWALGEENAIADLKDVWKKILAGYENAALLDASLDFKGLCRH